LCNVITAALDVTTCSGSAPSANYSLSAIA
jgi:hypothetical protein